MGWDVGKNNAWGDEWDVKETRRIWMGEDECHLTTDESK
jgi:hypothetical protein